MLALGSDAAVKDAAVKEFRGANWADEQAATGDAWWDAAQGRDVSNGTPSDSARFWYRQAEPKLAGKVVGLKIKQRLEELSELDRQTAGQMH